MDQLKLHKTLNIALMTIIFMNSGLCFFLTRSGSINRSVSIVTKDSKSQDGILEKIDSQEITFLQKDIPEKKSLLIDEINKIVFLTEEIKKQQGDSGKSGPLGNFTGTYRADVAGYPATLEISTTGPRANIKFHSWGKGLQETLKDVRIERNRITFTRSCSGKECDRIGSPGPLNQKYNGEISSDSKKISGNYTSPGSSGKWTAVKK